MPGSSRSEGPEVERANLMASYRNHRWLAEPPHAAALAAPRIDWPVALGVIALSPCGISFLLYAQEFQRRIEECRICQCHDVAERRRRQGL